MKPKSHAILSSIQGASTEIEAFYDRGISSENSSGSAIALKGTALFAIVGAMIGSTPELAQLSLGAGSITEVAVSAATAFVCSGAAFLAIVTGASAMDDRNIAKLKRHKH